MIQKLKFYFIDVKYRILIFCKSFLHKAIKLLKSYLFILVSLILSIIYFYSSLSIQDFDFSNILIAFTSVIATILTLAFTLSLIPIQNAASMWSFSILRIYKKDKITYWIFIIFGILILCLALFTIFEKNINDNFLLIYLIFSIGLILDSLRFYYTHIVSLMDPQSILEKIKKQAFMSIDTINEMVYLIAKNKYFLQKEDNKKDLNIFISQSYKDIPNYPQTVIYWFNDLSEIYQKSVARNDLIVAKATLKFMVEILNYCVEKRKNNIEYILVPTLFLPIKEADIDKEIITPFCEILKDLFIISHKNSTENIALEVIETYKEIAIFLSNIDIILTKIPIFYAKECIKYSQALNSIEVTFQSAKIFFDIHNNINEENIFNEVDIYIIEALENIIIYLYATNKSDLAEYSIQYLMQLNRFDNDFIERFKEILKIADKLIPFGLFNEINKNKLQPYIPLGNIYSPTSVSSIGQIYKLLSSKNDINLLVNMLDITRKHLRDIGQKYDLQNSFIIHEIDSTIEDISDINLYLFQNNNSFDKNKLIDKFKWLISFYWVAYDNKETFNKNYFIKCIETLKKISIDYMKIDFTDITLDILSTFKTFIQSDKISQDSFLKEDLVKKIKEIKTHSETLNKFNNITKKCEEILN